MELDQFAINFQTSLYPFCTKVIKVSEFQTDPSTKVLILETSTKNFCTERKMAKEKQSEHIHALWYIAHRCQRYIPWASGHMTHINNNYLD